MDTTPYGLQALYQRFEGTVHHFMNASTLKIDAAGISETFHDIITQNITLSSHT
jgi:hypothetical protein